MSGSLAQSVAAERYAVSFVKSKFDNKPTRSLVTWDELCDRLTTARRTLCTANDCGTGMHADLDKDGKSLGCRYKNGTAWIPATFSKGREKATAEFVSFLVVDGDHLPELDTTLAKLERYRYVGHATHSDRPGNRCVRIAIALSRPVAAKDWPRFWPAAMTSLGMPADPSCCDASRLYYEPARSSDADFWTAVHDGEPLDVDALLASAPAVTPTIAAQLKLEDGGIVGEGQRHAMLKSTAGALRHRGAGEVEILAGLTLANARCNPPKPDGELADLAAWAAAQPITTLANVPTFSNAGDLPAGLTVINKDQREIARPLKWGIESATAEWVTKKLPPREHLLFDMRTLSGAMDKHGVWIFAGAGGALSHPLKSHRTLAGKRGAGGPHSRMPSRGARAAPLACSELRRRGSCLG